MRRYGYKALFGVFIEVLLGAQFALATKKVTIIGMLGSGKSTVGNCFVDLTENSFLALDQPQGVTQGFRKLKSTIPGVEVIDTPGLCDPDMEIPVWIHRYNEQMSSQPEMRDVSLVVLIISPHRVSANEKILAAALDEAFKAIKSENLVLVVNRAPNYFEAARALQNYDVMRASVKNCTLPALSEDRVLVLPEVDHVPQKNGDIQPTIVLSKKVKQFVESHLNKLSDSQTITANQAEIGSITDKFYDQAVKDQIEKMKETFEMEKERILADAKKRAEEERNNQYQWDKIINGVLQVATLYNTMQSMYRDPMQSMQSIAMERQSGINTQKHMVRKGFQGQHYSDTDELKQWAYEAF